MADPPPPSSLQGPFVLKEKVRLRSTIKEPSESQNPNLEPQAKGKAESNSAYSNRAAERCSPLPLQLPDGDIPESPPL